MTEMTATWVDDQIASYSSKGPTPVDHICNLTSVAPGNRLVSLRVSAALSTRLSWISVGPSSGPDVLRTERHQHGNADRERCGGADVAANSALTPDQVKARLMKTRGKASGNTRRRTTAWATSTATSMTSSPTERGYLNVDAALGNTDLATGVALSQTAVQNSNGSVTVRIQVSTQISLAPALLGSGTNSTLLRPRGLGFGCTFATSVVWGATSVCGDTSYLGQRSLGIASGVASASSALSNGDPGDSN